MWKLTITQRKKSEYSGFDYDHHTEFKSSNILELSMLVDRMAECETECETSYKIERVEGE